MRQSPFDTFSPVYPRRAAWGTASSLRAWQADAFAQYEEAQPQDFLCVATPGAGKTTFALRVAHQLLATRTIKRIVVVTPTEHLKVQWADAAAKVGIQLDPGLNRSTKRGRAKEFDGSVVTYAGVSMRAWSYEALCHAPGRVIVSMNLEPHSDETRGYDLADHLEVLLRHAPELRIHTVLADSAAVLDLDRLTRAVHAAGAGLEVTDLVSEEPGVHDPQKLASAYTRLIVAN